MLVTTAAVNAPETSGSVVRDNSVRRLDSPYAILELNGTVHALIVAITTKMSARIIPAAGLCITTLCPRSSLAYSEDTVDIDAGGQWWRGARWIVGRFAEELAKVVFSVRNGRG